MKGSLSPPSPRKHWQDAPPKRRWPQKRNTWVLVNLDPTEEERWGKGTPWRTVKGARVQIARQRFSYEPAFKHMKVKSPHLYWWDAFWWWPMSETKWWRTKDVPNVSIPMIPAISLLIGSWAEPFDPQRIRHNWKHKPSCWMKFSYIAHFIKSKKLSVAICNAYEKYKQPKLRIEFTTHMHSLVTKSLRSL